MEVDFECVRDELEIWGDRLRNEHLKVKASVSLVGGQIRVHQAILEVLLMGMTIMQKQQN